MWLLWSHRPVVRCTPPPGRDNLWPSENTHVPYETAGQVGIWSDVRSGQHHVRCPSHNWKHHLERERWLTPRQLLHHERPPTWEGNYLVIPLLHMSDLLCNLFICQYVCKYVSSICLWVSSYISFSVSQYHLSIYLFISQSLSVCLPVFNYTYICLYIYMYRQLLLIHQSVCMLANDLLDSCAYMCRQLFILCCLFIHPSISICLYLPISLSLSIHASTNVIMLWCHYITTV